MSFTKIKIAGTKVTSQEVDDAIKDITYTRLGQKIVVAHIILQDGFEVIGKAGVVNSEEFDMEIGKKYALENAKQRVWEHMGSILQDRIAPESDSYMDRLISEKEELSRKVNKLKVALLQKSVPESAIEILTQQSLVMDQYLSILGKRLGN